MNYQAAQDTERRAANRTWEREVMGLGSVTRTPATIPGICYPLDPVAWNAAWQALSAQQKAVWFALTGEERSALERLDAGELASALTPLNPWTAPLPPITTAPIKARKPRKAARKTAIASV